MQPNGNRNGSIDETRDLGVSRRRILQSSAVTVGGVGVAGTASADSGNEPCEELIPDLTVFNRDGSFRTVSIDPVDGAESLSALDQTVRLEAYGSHSIDVPPSAIAGGRVRVTIDEDDDVGVDLENLVSEKFRTGLRITIVSGEPRVETQRIDLPPAEYHRLLARCDE